MLRYAAGRFSAVFLFYEHHSDVFVLTCSDELLHSCSRRFFAVLFHRQLAQTVIASKIAESRVVDEKTAMAYIFEFGTDCGINAIDTSIETFEVVFVYLSIGGVGFAQSVAILLAKMRALLGRHPYVWVGRVGTIFTMLCCQEINALHERNDF